MLALYIKHMYNEAMKKSSSVTTIRLTEDARRLLWRLGERLGITRTAVIELAIRRMAREEEVAARPVDAVGENRNGAASTAPGGRDN